MGGIRVPENQKPTDNGVAERTDWPHLCVRVTCIDPKSIYSPHGSIGSRWVFLVENDGRDEVSPHLCALERHAEDAKHPAQHLVRPLTARLARQWKRGKRYGWKILLLQKCVLTIRHAVLLATRRFVSDQNQMRKEEIRNLHDTISDRRWRGGAKLYMVAVRFIFIISLLFLSEHWLSALL